MCSERPALPAPPAPPADRFLAGRNSREQFLCAAIGRYPRFYRLLSAAEEGEEKEGSRSSRNWLRAVADRRSVDGKNFSTEGLLSGHWRAVGRKYQRGTGLGNAVGELGPEICWVLARTLLGTGGRILLGCWEMLLGNWARTLLGYWDQNSVGYWGLLLGNWGQNSAGVLGTAVGESRETDWKLLCGESAGELETDEGESWNCCSKNRETGNWC